MSLKAGESEVVTDKSSTAEELGRLEMDPAGDVTAGVIGTWRFRFTAVSRPIEPNGGIRLLVPHGFSPPIPLPEGWPPRDIDPNPNDITEFIPTDLGFVTVRCSRNNVKLELSLADPDQSFQMAVRGQTPLN